MVTEKTVEEEKTSEWKNGGEEEGWGERGGGIKKKKIFNALIEIENLFPGFSRLPIMLSPL